MNSQLSRRTFLEESALYLSALTMGSNLAGDTDQKPVLQIGLVTDLHYADKPEKGRRFYRDTGLKIREAVQFFNQHQTDFVVCLGDLIDKADSPELEIEWLKRIEAIYAETQSPRHYVLGNHCVGTLTKAEFAAHTGASKTPHYSFNSGGFHFVVLDSCFRSDGVAYERDNFDWKDSNVPQAQLEWLRADLASTQNPVVVWAHQRLDQGERHSVKNAAAVREILETSSKVLAVFQGHSHENDYQQIAGIHYCTLAAMVEGPGADNNGYALLEVMADRSLRLRGFRRQASRSLRSTAHGG